MIGINPQYNETVPFEYYMYVSDSNEYVIFYKSHKEILTINFGNKNIFKLSSGRVINQIALKRTSMRKELQCIINLFKLL